MSRRIQRSLAVPLLGALVAGIAALALPYGGMVERAAAGVLSAITTDPGELLANTTLSPPSGLTAQASGANVALAWSAGNGSGYSLGWQTSAGSSCPSSGYPAGASTTALTYTDTSHSGTAAGTWVCYQATSTDLNWSSQSGNPTVAAQVGFLVNSVTVTNGGTAGVIDTGDKVVIMFNQPANAPSIPSGDQYVCASTSTSSVYLFTTNQVPCAGWGGFTLAGGSVTSSKGRGDDAYAAIYAWSNGSAATGYSTLTVTLGADSTGRFPTSSGSWTLTALAGGLTSFTGGLSICTTSPNCTPTSATGF